MLEKLTMTGKEGNLAFTEYERMTNDLSEFVDDTEFLETKWVVTEKIHGANFSFHTNGELVRVARRRGFIRDDERFFDYRTGKFMKTHPNKVQKIYTLVTKILNEKDIEQVSVYGELFGGNYKVFTHGELFGGDYEE